ncbi:hypothetical protein ACFU8Q_32445 [Streptomyces sp. NPDC057543]|uniref:hypothetical protein n=1 Tax=Streptomyces sp. NPDC057543 TaxID=3346163 RepID=UPI0036AC1B5B
MTNNLDALLTALYVKIDDEIGGTRWLGRPPWLTDSEHWHNHKTGRPVIRSLIAYDH